MSDSNQLDKIVLYHENFLKEQQQLLDCAIVFGFIGTGKSTFCQLLNAFVSNKRNPNFAFDDGKIKSFTLPEIISTNSLKMCTKTPAIYQITPTIKQLPELTIIDTSALMLPPPTESNKKWSSFDSIVAFNYLIQTVNSASFILMIEEKYTRLKMEGLKTILESFLSFFTIHSEQLLNSTQIILCRCASAIKIETIYTRLQTCIKKLSPQYTQIGEQWLLNIKKRRALIIQHKFSSEKDAEEQAIAIYQEISKLSKYQIKQTEICILEKMSQSQKDNLINYYSEMYPRLQKLIEILQGIITERINTIQELNSEKEDLIGTSSENDEKKLNQSKVYEVKQTVMPNMIDCLIAMGKLIQEIDNVSEETISNIGRYFEKCQILNESDEIFNGILDRGMLYRRFIKDSFPEIMETVINNLKKLRQFNKNMKKDEKLTYLDNTLEPGKDIEFYKKIQNAIKALFNESEMKTNKIAQNMMTKVKIQIAGLQPPSKSFLALLQLLKFLNANKNYEMLGGVYEKIAEKLISVDKIEQALELLSNCTNPQRAIDIVTPLLETKEKCKKYPIQTYIPYLKFLQSAGLIQRSYEMCYKLGDYFQEITQRKNLQKFLKATPSKPNDKIIQAFIYKKSQPIKQEVIKMIQQIANNLTDD